MRQEKEIDYNHNSLLLNIKNHIPMKTLKVFTVSAIMIFFTVYYTNAQVKAETEKEILRFSLNAAQEYAVQNANDAKNMELNAKISKKRTLEIITEGLPQVTGSVNYQYNFHIQQSVIPAGTFGPQQTRDEAVKFGVPFSTTAGIEAQQLIVDGRYFLGLKANKAIIAVSEQQVEMTAIDIKNQVAKSYYAALVAEESKIILEKSFTTVQKILSETEAFYKAGLVEELDVDRLKVSSNLIESQLKNNNLQANLAKNFLKYQMGLPFEQEIELTDKLEPLLLAYVSEEEVSTFNPQDRIEFRLLETQYALRGYDAKQFSLGYLPAIYGTYRFGRNTFRSQDGNVFRNNWQDEWYLYGVWGISLQVTLFDGFRKGFQYQQKKLEQAQIKNNIQNFENQSKVQVGNAYLSYQTANENYKNQKGNFDLAKKISSTVQTKYKNGVAGSVEVAQAESSLIQAQGDLIQAIYNLLTARTDLDKALGKIK
jgi:outer membrane protein